MRLTSYRWCQTAPGFPFLIFNFWVIESVGPMGRTGHGRAMTRSLEAARTGMARIDCHDDPACPGPGIPETVDFVNNLFLGFKDYRVKIGTIQRGLAWTFAKMTRTNG